MGFGNSLINSINDNQDISGFRAQNWQGSFGDYLELVLSNPGIARRSYQRVFDMIMSYGTEEYYEYKKKITRYKFFNDPFDNGQDAVFGIDIHLMKLVNVFRAAAEGYGADRRVILLHGPVGSAKSTIARLLKKGLEHYSRTDTGALYTFSWNEEFLKEGAGWMMSPMNEEPLLLVPPEMRDSVEKELNANNTSPYPLKIKGELSPVSRFMYREILKKVDGDWSEMIKHVRIHRLILSEKDRIGIGTFQPKDEKNQDSTELTGDVNYRKIAEYGSDSDPRAFNFDGEFCIANRGIIEFIEVLKLDVAFLYDLLGASQEHKIKPKKFAQTDIDEVILGHTNEPEYRRLMNNEFMEALRDRTIKIDVPYITRASLETRIYEKDFNAKRVKKHIAPHTLEMAAMWAVLTRLEEPKKANLTLIQKLKLYDGKTLPGFTEDNIKELRKSAIREGLEGISPRYIQDKISNALVRYDDTTSINPFLVLRELESGLKTHSLISNEEVRTHYRELLAVVKKEYEELVKNEVQKAITADEGAIARLCMNYIENVKAHTQKEKVRNRFTQQMESPNERLMRSIEEKIDVPVSRKDDFRREIMNYIGALAIEGRTFDYSTNERLNKALELKLFEDQKDSIKLASIVSEVVDQDTQKKIDVVKQRLIDKYGYNDESATDVLNFVASIFARGDIKEG